jgi:hypothetical protein
MILNTLYILENDIEIFFYLYLHIPLCLPIIMLREKCLLLNEMETVK